MFPASNCTAAAARRLRILVAQHRVVEQRWRRRTSYHICRLQCALPAQPLTARKIRSFLRPSPFPLPPFPAEKILRTVPAASDYDYDGTASVRRRCSQLFQRRSHGHSDIRKFRKRETRLSATVIHRHRPNYFPLFGKSQFPQKTNFKSLTRPDGS